MKMSKSSFRKLLQEQVEKTIIHRKLTTGETKRLANLETIADKLKRRENVQTTCHFS